MPDRLGPGRMPRCASRWAHRYCGQGQQSTCQVEFDAQALRHVRDREAAPVQFTRPRGQAELARVRWCGLVPGWADRLLDGAEQRTSGVLGDPEFHGDAYEAQSAAIQRDRPVRLGGVLGNAGSHAMLDLMRAHGFRSGKMPSARARASVSLTFVVPSLR
jgi:hypothetical protein